MRKLIDQQQAAKRIQNKLNEVYQYPKSEYAEGYVNACKAILKMLDDMPSVQSEQQWISCNKRMPEKTNIYTVTDSNGHVVRFAFTGTDSSREFWKRCAKAWMPLPKPYREE